MNHSIFNYSYYFIVILWHSDKRKFNLSDCNLFLFNRQENICLTEDYFIFSVVYFDLLGENFVLFKEKFLEIDLFPLERNFVLFGRNFVLFC